MSQEPKPLAEILVPIDFSECSLNAFEFAKRIAAACGARLHLLYVDDDAILMQSTTDPSYHEPHDRKMMSRLAGLLTSEEKERFPAIAEVRVGTAYYEIQEYAAENGIDLIVMGNVGRSVIADALLGSVSAHVIHHAPCPVLSVKKPTYTPEWDVRPVQQAATKG